MSEAAVTDLKRYQNLGELFRRQLKVGCRPVEQNCPLVCVLSDFCHCDRLQFRLV